MSARRCLLSCMYWSLLPFFTLSSDDHLLVFAAFACLQLCLFAISLNACVPKHSLFVLESEHIQRLVSGIKCIVLSHVFVLYCASRKVAVFLMCGVATTNAKLS